MQRIPQLSFPSFFLRTFLSVFALLSPGTPLWAGSTGRRSSDATTTVGTSSGGSTGAVSTTSMLTARDSIRRSTVTVNGVAAMQAAARQAARANSVQTRLNVARASDGTPILWNGADPVADSTGSLTVIQREQQAYLEWSKFNLGTNDTLTFDQKTYGGANASQWIAFNFVRDSDAKPSQIFGAIKAEGQVYILNANGILFGGTAQVNTHALVASSLPINPNLLKRGLLVQNAADVQFLFSGLSKDLGNSTADVTNAGFDPNLSVAGYTPVQTPYLSDKSGGVGTTYGKIEVAEGAQLVATDDADNHVGGRIALFAPYVQNSGLVQANDGQVIMAAGLQVGMASHRSDDPTLRGLDVYVGKTAYSNTTTNTDEQLLRELTGTVENSGILTAAGELSHAGFVQAQRGSIYIAGKAINQNGVLDSSTSVSYNGRIDLAAAYNAVPANLTYNPNSTEANQLLTFLTGANMDPGGGTSISNSGAVEFGTGSISRILPETYSSERATGDLALPSMINVQGASVKFAAESILLAPSAAVPRSSLAYGADGIQLTAGVTISAGSWFYKNAGGGQTPNLFFVQTADSELIDLGAGATVDVAGLNSDDIRYIGLTSAGHDVELPSVSENIVSVELRGNELAGSPLQRDGALRGQAVQVDIRQHGAWDSSLNDNKGGYTWVGTSVADTSGWVGLVTHSISELSIDGGSVAIKAGGALTLQGTSKIDVSGGSIDYQGGYVQTTKLLQDGHWVDISKASASQLYDGIYNGTTTIVDKKWGVTKTFVNALPQRTYQAGYTQGGNGGSLQLTAPLLTLSGDLKGQTISGVYQPTLSPLYDPTNAATYNPASPIITGVPTWLTSSQSMPVSAQLAINVGRQQWNSAQNQPLSVSPTPADIVITAEKQPANSALNKLYLDVGLFGSTGFGILSIDNSNDNNVPYTRAAGDTGKHGTITISGNEKLELSAGGVLNLKAANIIMEDGSSIKVPGGSVALKAYDISPSLKALVDASSGSLTTGEYNPDRGSITLVGSGTSGATIDVAGLVVEDRSNAHSLSPVVIDGGKIELSASTVDFQSGSTLDVSGGARISTTGKVTYGAAGSGSKGIVISSGLAVGDGTMGGWLKLDGTLKGFAGVGQNGGALSIVAPAITIQGESKKDDPTSSVWKDAEGRLIFRSDLANHVDFFSEGGFTSFSLAGLGLVVGSNGSLADMPILYSVKVAENTLVTPQVQNWVLLPGNSKEDAAPADVRLRKPVNLTLAASDIFGKGSGLLLGTGAVLQTDDGFGTSGSITLSANGDQSFLDIEGRLIAHGGTISLNAPETKNSSTSAVVVGGPTLHLGQKSVLDASGIAVWRAANTRPMDQNDGLVKSDVLDGGKISISGGLVAEAGSYISVAGTNDAIWNMPGDVTSITGLVSTVKNSNGGSLSITGKNMLFSEAILNGSAGLSAEGLSARGGELKIGASINSLQGDTNPISQTEPSLILRANTPGFQYQGIKQTVTQVIDGVDTGVPFMDSEGKGLGQSIFGVDTLKGSGFSSVNLSTPGNTLLVDGNVEITRSRQITVADGGMLSFTNGSRLGLSAPYIKIGTAFLEPGVANSQNALLVPTAGTGVLDIHANSLIDVGNLVLFGASGVNLDATGKGSTNGSIRGGGTLDVAGEITLTAGQIYPPTGLKLNIVANDWVSTDAGGNAQTNLGKITIKPSTFGAPAAPLSAGGVLGLYASMIEQSGVIRAPLGKINLGAAANTKDPLSGTTYLPVTSSLTLGSGSITSVSSDGLVIPYGINVNGDTWVAPSGADITNSDLSDTSKSIVLTSDKITLRGGDASKGLVAAVLNLDGGGDLMAYRFVTGTGGKKDILDSTTTAFAIVPASYSDSYAPYAPFQSGVLQLGNDRGYVFKTDSSGNPIYAIGTRIHLAGGDGLPAGDYTVLPARYALLAGAYLVTPRSGSATAGAAASLSLPDGSALVSGYLFSGLDASGQKQPLYQTFEVASQAVVVKRAEYDFSYGSEFFSSVAKKNDTVAPRLAIDAGQLVLNAQNALDFRAKVLAAYSAKDGGRASIVDLTSNSDIQIGGSLDATTSGSSKPLLLDPAQLSGLGSVLVGGTRTAGVSATSIVANTSKLEVSKGTSITGNDDLILVSKGSLLIDDGVMLASNESSGFVADALTIDGKGSAVRISSDASAALTRRNGASGTLTIGSATGAAVNFTAASITLDSSSASSISDNTGFGGVGGSAPRVNLSSSKIYVGDFAATDGLVLKGLALDSLSKVGALSLRSSSSSDSSINFAMGLTLGAPLSLLSKLELHAASLAGGNGSGAVTIYASDILLDNDQQLSRTGGQTSTGSGSLAISADTIRLGSGLLSIDNFTGGTTMNANREVLLQGKVKTAADGKTKLQPTIATSVGDFTLNTPVVLSTAAANQTISAFSKLTLGARTATAAADTAGLGANLSLSGSTVEIGTNIKLPSGTLSVQAMNGITVAGVLDVGGINKNFFDVSSSTNGGAITLVTTSGNIDATGATLNVGRSSEASAWAGSAGSLTITAPGGIFKTSSSTQLLGQAGTGGLGGALGLDIAHIDADSAGTNYLKTFHSLANNGGFDDSIAIRVRSGDVVVDGSARAHEYSLSADSGNVTLNKGTVIDASGLASYDKLDTAAVDLTNIANINNTTLGRITGGSIDISARGSVALLDSSILSVAGYCYDNAGKGGSISLAAGGYTYDNTAKVGTVDSSAFLTLASGSKINLAVMHVFTPEDVVRSAANGAFNSTTATDLAATRYAAGDFATGTLHLRAPQTADGTGVQINPLQSKITGASAVVVEGFRVYDLSGTDGSNSASSSVKNVITYLGSSGIIDSAVEKQIATDGATFASGAGENGSIRSSLLAGSELDSSLLHIQSGSEIVNNGSATRQLVTIYKVGTAISSLTLPANARTKVAIPGGLPVGDVIKSPRACGVYFDDGSGPVAFSANAAIVSTDTKKVVALEYTTTTAATTSLTTSTATASTVYTPFTVALDAGTGSTIASTLAVKTMTSGGDLTLANTWNLGASAYRFGDRNNQEPGILTLRAKNNLVFTYDASLSDGFDTDSVYGLWMGTLKANSRSWSYRMVSGADYAAVDTRQVRSSANFSTEGTGSVLIGRGAVALPTTGTQTRAGLVPQFYQTIRTGTGDIEIFAGRDVRLLNPLATVYTAGTAAESINGFTPPDLSTATIPANLDSAQGPVYVAQYAKSGGDITVVAQNDIKRSIQKFDGTGALTSTSDDSVSEMPTNWLYRQGYVDPSGKFGTVNVTNALGKSIYSTIASTSWWVDYSNFFDDIGTLGGGNISITAGNDVKNINASVATNARMPGYMLDANNAKVAIAPDATQLVELGGGNLAIRAGRDLDAGVYYAERGSIDLNIGGAVITNDTRYALFAPSGNIPVDRKTVTLLPTTFFLGKGEVDITAGGDVRIGSVANPFLLPQGANNRRYETTYFSTFDATDSVKVSSLGGQVSIQAKPIGGIGAAASLVSWYAGRLNYYANNISTAGITQPWLRLSGNFFKQSGNDFTDSGRFLVVSSLLPSSLSMISYTDDINIVGTLTLTPAQRGNIDLLAAGSINGITINSYNLTDDVYSSGESAINLSDAPATALPGVTGPLGVATSTQFNNFTYFETIESFFAETGSTNLSLAQKLTLHGQSGSEALHYSDLDVSTGKSSPIHLYAAGGDISGITLFSAKSARIAASQDIADVALYIQNIRPDDLTLVSAGRDITVYDSNSSLRLASVGGSSKLFTYDAGAVGVATGAPNAGDIQIAGPGSLEVLAGRDLTLGTGANTQRDGTAAGITSVGAERNPSLTKVVAQEGGADVLAAAGVRKTIEGIPTVFQPGLAYAGFDFAAFASKFLDPITAVDSRYLPALGEIMGLGTNDTGVIWSAFSQEKDAEKKARWMTQVFTRILRDSGRDRSNGDSPYASTYALGVAAIQALMPGSLLPDSASGATSLWHGNISMPTKLIKTYEGGDVALMVPGGSVMVGRVSDKNTPDQGVLTQRGGAISIFASGSVDVGTSRIFTLRGGDEVIWSTLGNIAAGSGSKTVFSAPPTRVLVDPQSADVQNDLAGLATGSGIGVLATLAGVAPGDVDLIAPAGTIDAGDAGIRSSGKVNVSAAVIVNGANIQSSAGTSGAPVVAPPSVSPAAMTPNNSVATNNTVKDAQEKQRRDAARQEEAIPSIIQVEILGYGGGDGEETAQSKDAAGNG